MAVELIVNADDFGLSPSINMGIIDAHHSGIVTSCSLMISIASPSDIDMLRDEPNIGVGIHINLTRGKPMFTGSLKDLVDVDGNFHIQHHTGFEGVDKEEIRKEVRTQVDAALATGLTNIDHIDTHHHAQRHRKVFDAVKHIAAEKGLACRASDEWMVGELKDAGVLCNDNFIEDFFGLENIGVANLTAIIEGLSEGVTELMCHPGFLHEPFKLRSGYIEERMTEMETLAHPAVKDAIEQKKVHLINFSNLIRRDTANPGLPVE